ncbi:MULTISPECIES: TRAP transporter small permease [Hyphomicrobiales]|jgi:TRAP-type transport system small permease protein|uniref:TRAP transporter small permease protein n=1 Tax=Bosea massiliensis TaxID=151419 RepID=A0ABW0P8R3_9HYPH|nr:TRAP transporter small permease [Methylobacterium sp. CCH7-A2]
MPLSRFLLRQLENLLILAFVVMIAMVFGNVVLRYLFNSGITMSDEASRMIFVWLTFGGAFLVALEGGHLGMTAIVQMLGLRGRRLARLVAESLSLFCMGLLVFGCWQQSSLNMANLSPVMGVPTAIFYIAGLACGLGIGAINLVTLIRLLTGRVPPGELVIGAESEEMAGFEAQRQEPPRP